MCELISSPGFFTIYGIIIGFLLSEVSRYLHYLYRIRKMKRIIKEELSSIKLQLIDKRNIINQVMDALSNDTLLPARSVGIINTGYRQFYSDIYEHLIDDKRICLFYIHQILEVGEHTLNNFENEFQIAINQGVLTDPHKAFISKFNDLLKAYIKVERLIDSYIEGNPINPLSNTRD